MKLRLLGVLALLVAVAGGAHAADSGKKANSSDSAGIKNLTVPSLEVGGGALGISTDQPNDPDVPTINDPQKLDKPVEPFFGLKFTKPLDDN